MEIKCPVNVDGRVCDRKLVKQEVEDNKLGLIEVFVCELGHRPFCVLPGYPGKSNFDP